MSGSPVGLLASLRGFTATAVGLLRTRLELFKLELHEEAGRLIGLMLWGVAGVLLAVVGVVFVAVFLTVLFWEEHRLLALGAFAFLFSAAAVVAIGKAGQLISRGSGLFAASLAELRRDETALRPTDAEQ